MEIINNCDELLAHLCADELHSGSHQYSCGGYLEFQGELCEVGGIGGYFNSSTLFTSYKHPNTLFGISDSYTDNEHFVLSVFVLPHNSSFVLDQTLGVELPNYVKDELIATIQSYN